MKKRILASFLSMCLLVGTLVGCGGTQNTQDTTTAETTVTSELSDSTEEVTDATDGALTVIAADGSTQFTIIRPDGASSVVVSTAVSLYQSLNDIYGSKVGISDDWVRTKDEDGTVTTEDYEILVGETNRKETALAKEQMGSNDYIITVINHKVVILGKNATSLKYAVELFLSEFVGSAGTALVLSAENTVSGTGASAGIDLTDGAHFRIMSFNVLGSSENGEQRYPYIMEIIETYAPDIIGFQEFNAAQHSNTLAPLLKNGYSVNCATHTNSSTKNYTPIVYRTDKFTKIDAGIEWLDSRYTGTNTKSISWVVLKDNATGKNFAVINMHGAVLSNSYSGYETMSSSEMSKITAQWRVDNVRQLLEIHDRIKEKHGDIAFLFTGDFNFTASSEAYSKLKAAGVTEAEVSSTGKRVTGTKTTHTVGSAPVAGSSIDHVFYYPETVTALRHHVAKDEAFELNASDHCAVFADVMLK